MSALPTQPAHGLPVALPLPLPLPEGSPTPFEPYGLLVLVWLLAPGPLGPSGPWSGWGGRVVAVVGLVFEFVCAAMVTVGVDGTVVGDVVVVVPTFRFSPLATPFVAPLPLPLPFPLPAAKAAVGSRINPIAKHVAEAPARRRLYPFFVT